MKTEQGVLPGLDLFGYDWPEPRALPTADGWNPTLRYVLVTTEEALDQMIETLRWADEDGIAWDTETSGLKPELGARIVGHAFACRTAPDELTGWYIPIRHIGPHQCEAQLSEELVTAKLRPFFESGGEVMTFHAKFDMKMARADGLWLQRPVSDIAIEATAHNENEPRFALKALMEKYGTPGARSEEKELDDWMRTDARKLGLVYKKYSKQQRKKLRERGLDELSEPTYMQRFGYARTPIKLCGRYACHDVFYTWWLSKVKYRHVRTRFADLWMREHEVMHQLLDMEWRGLAADEHCIRDTHERTKHAVEHWLSECQRLAPGILDVTFEGTDTELRELYYGALKMKPPKLTSKDGKPSVDKEARKLLAKQYPKHAELLEAVGHLAQVTKLHTTYAGNYLRFYSPVTKTINPSYNQLERRDKGGAPVTGRLSSADPNNQNVTGSTLHLWDCGCSKCVDDQAVALAKEWWDWSDDDVRRLLKAADKAKLHERDVGIVSALRAAAKEGRQDGENTVSIRRYFVVPEGRIRVYIDFSQIELRVLAWLCQDPTMLRAYREGLDLHQLIADELGILRKIAKQVNFGNSYGMTKFGLALRLPGYYDDPEGTIARAELILEAYFRRYPRILAFKAEFSREMRRNGCMFISPFGRPRRIPEIAAVGEDRWMRKGAERRMMSSIVSGTAADLMKESMRRTNPIARAAGGEMVQTIHDELVFDLLRQSGWAGTVLRLVDRMEDWPMFSEDRPHLPDFAPGRFGVPIRASVELSTTSWEGKREVEIVDGSSFRWAA